MSFLHVYTSVKPSARSRLQTFPVLQKFPCIPFNPYLPPPPISGDYASAFSRYRLYFLEF